MYSRLARWCFRHPWQVIGTWVSILVISIGITGAAGTAYDGSFNIPDSESRDGSLILDEYFGGLGGGQAGSIVFEAPQGVEDATVQA
ncbi:MAG: MMPL family transporter, partial [Acidimicrobiales bacterium]